MSRAIAKANFDVFTDKTIKMLINNFSSTHIECLKNGGIITINCYGMWCSIDDLEPIMVDSE